MPTRRARLLAPNDVQRLLRHVQGQRYPTRNRVIVLLSFRAGLRACEIAGLDWTMVLTSDAKIDDMAGIGAAISKGGRGRSLPIHSELRSALRALHREQGRPLAGPVIQSERGGHLAAGSIVNWFSETYRELDLIGCSSHSGRRTFITRAARLLVKSGGSLRDIQELAGHQAITTTERYIEGDRLAQRRLIALL